VTEQEWLESTNRIEMLNAVYLRASKRKLRLFDCACVRRVWGLLHDERTRAAVEDGEWYADGLASAKERARAWEAASEAAVLIPRTKAQEEAAAVAACEAVDRPRSSTVITTGAAYRVDRCGVVPLEEEWKAQAAILRDIFGPRPQRPDRVPDAVLGWNDGAVRKIARTVYDDRAFDRLPILADALEDAGCTDPTLLAHLRGPGPHVLGCWAVDLLLGKH
jgi:hypothetical protein